VLDDQPLKNYLRNIEAQLSDVQEIKQNINQFMSTLLEISGKQREVVKAKRHIKDTEKRMKARLNSKYRDIDGTEVSGRLSSVRSRSEYSDSQCSEEESESHYTESLEESKAISRKSVLSKRSEKS
jgi:hypothetical protein